MHAASGERRIEVAQHQEQLGAGLAEASRVSPRGLQPDPRTAARSAPCWRRSRRAPRWSRLRAARAHHPRLVPAPAHRPASPAASPGTERRAPSPSLTHSRLPRCRSRPGPLRSPSPRARTARSSRRAKSTDRCGPARATPRARGRQGGRRTGSGPPAGASCARRSSRGGAAPRPATISRRFRLGSRAPAPCRGSAPPGRISARASRVLMMRPALARGAGGNWSRSTPQVSRAPARAARRVDARLRRGSRCRRARRRRASDEARTRRLQRVARPHHQEIGAPRGDAERANARQRAEHAVVGDDSARPRDRGRSAPASRRSAGSASG